MCRPVATDFFARFGPTLAFGARLIRPRFTTAVSARIAWSLLAAGTFARLDRAALPLLRRPSFRPSLALPARLARTRFGTRPALPTVPIEPRLLAFAANISAGLAPLRPARRLTRGAKLVDPDFPVAVAVELAQHIGRLAHLLGVDHAIVIRVESVEDSGHRPLRILAASFTFTACAIGAWRIFAARFRIRPRAAFATRFTVARGAGGTGVRIVLGGERPRGEREDHRSGKEGSGIHRWGFWVAARWPRP